MTGPYKGSMALVRLERVDRKQDGVITYCEGLLLNHEQWPLANDGERGIEYYEPSPRIRNEKKIALYLRFTSRGGPRLSLGAEAGVFLNCATGSAKSSKRMGAGVGVGAGVSSAQCT